MALSHAIDLTAAVWLVCRGRRCGPRAVASLASGLYVGPIDTTPGDDVSSSPGAGAGGEVAAPRIKIKSGGGKDAGRLRLFVAGSRRRPPSPEPRAACRLAFSSALFFSCAAPPKPPRAIDLPAEVLL